MNRTLGNALCSRDNALNFIRLLLAMAVIFWHTYPTSGAIPSWPAAELGAWAVNAFFALSGFLIAGSRLHLKFWPYLGRRAARVFPAFWTVLVVTGFVFAPISTIFTGRAYRLDDGLNYVAQNSLLWPGELGVGETLRGIPHPDSWNGSLWTLFFEFGAYLAAGTLLSIRLVRRKLVWVSLAILAILSVAVASGIGEGFPRLLDQIVPAVRLWSFFAAGMLAYALRDRIPTTVSVGLASGIALALTFSLGAAGWLGQIPLAVLLLWLGARIPVRVGSSNDVSYGMYVYAFPVQQLLVVAGFAKAAGPELSAVTAAALTLPFAWASWRFIERPAIESCTDGRVKRRREWRRAR